MKQPPPPHGGGPVIRAGVPLDQARGFVIAVHGRGAGPANILDLVPALDQPGLSWAAPAAAGGTWYPKSFMAPIPENEPGITSGIAVVHGLIEEARAAGMAENRIAVLGFSQGACLACTAVQRRPARYGCALVFSGGLIGPPGTTWTGPASFAGTPVFFGCSDVDAHVPEARVKDSAEVFARMGAQVTTRIYPGMGHLINDDELAIGRALIGELLSH